MAPTSLVVPPTSRTTALLSVLSRRPESHAAPRMLFVGPLEKVRIGSREAVATSATVPSFCVRKSGTLSSRNSRSDARRDASVCDASGCTHALRIAAFSRSSMDIPATSCDCVTAYRRSTPSPPWRVRSASRMRAAACLSCAGLIGEHTPATTMHRTPLETHASTKSSTSESTTGAISRWPSISKPPETSAVCPRTISASGRGKEQKGGTATVELPQRRSTPTRESSDRFR